MQKAFAFTYTLGAAPVPDMPSSKLILIWGKQPVYSGSTRGNLKQILDAKERGAKIISIKPTMEPDVAISDLWIPIRPGTDAALALAMLHVIIHEKLYDATFVAQWTYGFDKLGSMFKVYARVGGTDNGPSRRIKSSPLPEPTRPPSPRASTTATGLNTRLPPITPSAPSQS